MDERVKQAAERLRRGYYEPVQSNSYYEMHGFTERQGDQAAIAGWALPLLDETPATKKWCESIGTETRALYQGDDWVPTLLHEDGWITMPQGTTRGGVRMLCLALGIELKEPAHA